LTGFARRTTADFYHTGFALFNPHRFPEASGLAAAFDAPLVHRMAEAIAVDGRFLFDMMPRAEFSIEG
jgi:hypothetical protein